MDDFRILGDQIIEAERFIEQQKPQQCDLCGQVAELRPYGPNGEAVCFPCGMKDEPAGFWREGTVAVATRMVPLQHLPTPDLEEQR